jgi:hypothetical protein
VGERKALEFLSLYSFGYRQSETDKLSHVIEKGYVSWRAENGL